VTPLVLEVERLPTPLGEMLVLGDRNGFLRAVDWKDCEPRMHALLRRQYGPGALTLVEARAASPARCALERYLAGELDALDALPTRTAGTAFQRGVWAALREIPVGQTTSYAALACRLGRPRAVRAVGAANGANPVGIVIPCHRVVGSDGALTGYGGGVHRKRWLLDHERTHRLESP
jgi:methylated-DNA-[protein]-cysteine S-methyltransferase